MSFSLNTDDLSFVAELWSEQYQRDYLHLLFEKCRANGKVQGKTAVAFFKQSGILVVSLYTLLTSPPF